MPRLSAHNLPLRSVNMPGEIFHCTPYTHVWGTIVNSHLHPQVTLLQQGFPFHTDSRPLADLFLQVEYVSLPVVVVSGRPMARSVLLGAGVFALTAVLSSGDVDISGVRTTAHEALLPPEPKSVHLVRNQKQTDGGCYEDEQCTCIFYPVIPCVVDVSWLHIFCSNV